MTSYLMRCGLGGEYIETFWYAWRNLGGRVKIFSIKRVYDPKNTHLDVGYAPGCRTDNLILDNSSFILDHGNVLIIKNYYFYKEHLNKLLFIKS